MLLPDSKLSDPLHDLELYKAVMASFWTRRCVGKQLHRRATQVSSEEHAVPMTFEHSKCGKEMEKKVKGSHWQ